MPNLTIVCSFQNDCIRLRCITAEDNCKKYQKTIEQLNKKLEELNSAMMELGQENQNLQVVQNQRSARKWEKDSEVIQCNGCSKKFSVSIRKVMETFLSGSCV